MSDLVVALGLVLVLEGLVYALVPGAMKAMVVEIVKLPEATMRVFGLAAICLGVFIVWLVRGG